MVLEHFKGPKKPKRHSNQAEGVANGVHTLANDQFGGRPKWKLMKGFASRVRVGVKVKVMLG